MDVEWRLSRGLGPGFFEEEQEVNKAVGRIDTLGEAQCLANVLIAMQHVQKVQDLFVGGADEHVLVQTRWEGELALFCAVAHADKLRVAQTQCTYFGWITRECGGEQQFLYARLRHLYIVPRPCVRLGPESRRSTEAI